MNEKTLKNKKKNLTKKNKKSSEHTNSRWHRSWTRWSCWWWCRSHSLRIWCTRSGSHTSSSTARTIIAILSTRILKLEKKKEKLILNHFNKNTKQHQTTVKVIKYKSETRLPICGKGKVSKERFRFPLKIHIL